MSRFAAFQLGLHCLLAKVLVYVFPINKGLSRTVTNSGYPDAAYWGILSGTTRVEIIWKF